LPFIKRKNRPKFDPIVDLMKKLGVKADGDLNYILFKYCKYHIEPSYANYKNYKGELNECVDIIHTEIVVPYEKEKKRENGDV